MGLGLDVKLFDKGGKLIDMDVLVRNNIELERRTNSSIRKTMSPSEPELDPTATVAIPRDDMPAFSEESLAEEGLSITSGNGGDNE